MIFSIKIQQIWMLNTSAGQIVARFIVWDIGNFWSIYMLKSVSFHFFTFSGAPKPRKKLGDDKKLGGKNLMMHSIYLNIKYDR